jgi:toxin ParE1/3/4
MARSVIWSDLARDELYEIFLSISETSDKYAEIVADQIVSATRKLENFPNLGRVIPEVNNPAFREIIIERYRIMYFVRKDGNVEIIDIFHSSRKIPRPSA